MLRCLSETCLPTGRQDSGVFRPAGAFTNGPVHSVRPGTTGTNLPLGFVQHKPNFRKHHLF